MPVKRKKTISGMRHRVSWWRCLRTLVIMLIALTVLLGFYNRSGSGMNIPKTTKPRLVIRLKEFNGVNVSNKTVLGPNYGKKRFLVSSRTNELIKCGDDLEVELISKAHPNRTDFSFSLNIADNGSPRVFGQHRHYYVVFGMESEVHSRGGHTWSNADFRMWYDMDKSFPAPASYFNVRSYLVSLLSRPQVDFDKKDKAAPLVWIISNCKAHNAREKFIQKLMKLIKIDSFGTCLCNKRRDGLISARMKINSNLYSFYKFVISIENSNCYDYVTEKLVFAVNSGSIPLVAGKDDKPNYARFLPKGSYINILDYRSLKELSKHLSSIASDRNLYESYMSFKFKHNYTSEQLKTLSLSEIVKIAREVLNYQENREFFHTLLEREKSEAKECKVARYLQQTPYEQVEKEIKQYKMNRPSVSEACLEKGYLNYF